MSKDEQPIKKWNMSVRIVEADKLSLILTCYVRSKKKREAMYKDLSKLIASKRIDEVKQATVGRVLSPRNRNQKTYMSGFGYAVNNLQDYKTKRLYELQSGDETEIK